MDVPWLSNLLDIGLHGSDHSNFTFLMSTNQIGALGASFNNNTPITTTIVTKCSNVTQTNPTLEIATKSFTNNKLHFKKMHKDQY
jgi:hypothetical protein